MSFGERIVQARTAKGWSRRRLADESGVPYPTLAGLESSDQKSSTATPALAAALNVNALWLATGRGPREVSVINAAFSDAEAAPTSQTQEWNAAILAEAIKWLTFEETASGEPAHPLRRAQRLIALYQAIQADGGTLSPEHARELIEATRPTTQQGKQNHGKGGKRNGTT